MKRVKNLMIQISRSDNVEEAYLRAIRGKRDRTEVLKFSNDLEKNLVSISSDMASGCYEFSPYREFTINDPKQRIICAAAFRDRVAFHAMMRVCHKIFDNYQIYDSYASRIGKGVYAALDRAQSFCRKNAWFAKIDVVKYFDSIDKEIMLSQLSRLFKDSDLMKLFRNLLDTYETSYGTGLPIGNLTSQYFANHYLAVADHYCKEEIGVKYMIRYMDDMVFFSDNKESLIECCRKYELYLADCLKLRIHPVVLNRTEFGLPFLGYVVYPNCLRLGSNSKHRFIKRMTARRNEVREGKITQKEYAVRVASMYAFVEKANVCGFKASVRINGLFP